MRYKQIILDENDLCVNRSGGVFADDELDYKQIIARYSSGILRGKPDESGIIKYIVPETSRWFNYDLWFNDIDDSLQVYSYGDWRKLIQTFGYQFEEELE